MALLQELDTWKFPCGIRGEYRSARCVTAWFDEMRHVVALISGLRPLYF